MIRPGRTSGIAFLVRGAPAWTKPHESDEKLTSFKPVSEATPVRPDQPLFVDLDGTLVRTDLLWEALCLLVRTHPRKALALPVPQRLPIDLW